MRVVGWCGTYLLSKFGFEGGWRGATCVSSLAIIESGVGAALEDGCVGGGEVFVQASTEAWENAAQEGCNPFTLRAWGLLLQCVYLSST